MNDEITLIKKKETIKLVCACGAVYEQTTEQGANHIPGELQPLAWLGRHKDCSKYHNVAVYRTPLQSTAAEALIAKQTARLDVLSIKLAERSSRLSKIHKILTCIGGGLNDNRLGYDKKQMAELQNINDIAEG